MTTVLAHELRASLIELAERTYSQLVELFKDTTPERCDLKVRQLHEVSSVCRRLGSEVTEGESPTV
jgi:hypothetical protein